MVHSSTDNFSCSKYRDCCRLTKTCTRKAGSLPASTLTHSSTVPVKSFFETRLLSVVHWVHVMVEFIVLIHWSTLTWKNGSHWRHMPVIQDSDSSSHTIAVVNDRRSHPIVQSRCLSSAFSNRSTFAWYTQTHVRWLMAEFRSTYGGRSSWKDVALRRCWGNSRWNNEWASCRLKSMYRFCTFVLMPSCIQTTVSLLPGACHDTSSRTKKASTVSTVRFG